jgi:hypothetical protein
MRVWYCTREDVKTALDSKMTAYSDSRVDMAIAAGAQGVEGLLHRRYYPEITTRYRDWPNYDYSQTWRLYLGNNELISLTTLTSGGTVIPAQNYILRRLDDLVEPPYTVLEINLSQNSAFAGGTTFQQAIAMAGTFGYRDDQISSNGTLVTTVNNSITTVDVTNSVLIGVGSLIVLDTERMQVTARSALTTGATITSQMDSSNAFVNCPLSNGALVNEGETIYIDNEVMIVRRIIGNNATVQRAWDGSTLALHSGGATVYAPRHLTVTRAVLGTTAAGHTSGVTVMVQDYPGIVKELNIAYALNTVLQKNSGYARTAGTGDHQKEFTGRGIAQLESDAMAAVGRRNRVAAI